jgi:SOS response regulatory protein OraA/RecX
MIKIVYIKETKEKGILSLALYEGEELSRYTLDKSFIDEMKLCAGEITECELSEIKARDGYIRGKRKALSLLSFADNSKRSLLSKLIRFGTDRATAEKILNEMTDYGYIDEGRQISRLVISLATESLFGPKKIMARLVSRGYSPTDIRAAIRAAEESGEIDFSENRRLVLKKHSPKDETEANKILYKYGY